MAGFQTDNALLGTWFVVVMQEDEMRRLVEEAVAASRAAQAAAERLQSDQPSRFETLLDSLTRIITAVIETMFVRLKGAIDDTRRSGEEFVARVLRALSRSVRHLARALTFLLLAALLVTVATIILAIGIASGLNGWLGDPWGTLLAGVLFLGAGLAAASFARRKLFDIADEADALSPPRWR